MEACRPPACRSTGGLKAWRLEWKGTFGAFSRIGELGGGFERLDGGLKKFDVVSRIGARLLACSTL